jgi:hypothetical protein
MNTKKALEQLERTETAWETLAPDGKFYNMTLVEYKAKVQESRDARAVVAVKEQECSAATNHRNDVDKANLALEKNIAKGIAGDSEYGDDSDLYEGTGRVRKSERKSGLTRKKKNNTENE